MVSHTPVTWYPISTSQLEEELFALNRKKWAYRHSACPGARRPAVNVRKGTQPARDMGFVRWKILILKKYLMDDYCFILHSFDSNIVFDTPLASFFKSFFFIWPCLIFLTKAFFLWLSVIMSTVFVYIYIYLLCENVSPKLLKILVVSNIHEI